MTTSHSSPSPAGVVFPSDPRGSGIEPSERAQEILTPMLLLDLRGDGVAEGREELRHQQQVVMDAEGETLHPAQEVFARFTIETAEAPREGQPLEDAQAEPQAD